jgi:hypothetical protein
MTMEHDHAGRPTVDEFFRLITKAATAAADINGGRTIRTALGRALIDEGNRDDMTVYARLAAEHRNGGCGAMPLCPGSEVHDLMQMREVSHGQAYRTMLLLTALNVITEQQDEIARLKG